MDRLVQELRNLDKRGFSLVEVLVAAVVFAIVLIVIMSLIVVLSKTQRPTDQVYALSLSEEYLETRMSYRDLDSLVTINGVKYVLRVNVSKEDDLKLVDVYVIRNMSGDTISHYYTEVFRAEEEVE